MRCRAWRQDRLNFYLLRQAEVVEAAVQQLRQLYPLIRSLAGITAIFC